MLRFLLSCGYACYFLLALATWHLQSCTATQIKSGCTCGQVSSISGTCCKQFNLMNILQHCRSNFVEEPVSVYMCNIFVSQSPNIGIKFCNHSGEVQFLRYCQRYLGDLLLGGIHHKKQCFWPLIQVKLHLDIQGYLIDWVSKSESNKLSIVGAINS